MDAEDQIINEEQFIYEEQMQVCEHVLGEVEKQSTENIVAESSHHLYKRILDGVRTLHVLSEHAQPDDRAVDGVVILRTIHEAMLQLLWLLHDPARREHWAAMYLDYFHVEKLRMLWAIDHSGTDVAALADSENRPKVIAALRQDLTSFGPQFLSKEGRRQHRKRGDSYLYDPKAKYRPHWYPGHLLDLVEDRYVGEHAIFQRDASAAVHSSLWALHRGPNLKPEFQLFIGTRFCLRSAGAIAEALGIPLTDDQVEKIEHAEANIFDKPKRP